METQITLLKPHENVSIEYSVDYQSAGKPFFLCGLLDQFCSTEWFNQLIACRFLPECTCWAFATLATFYMCTPPPLLRSIPYHSSSQTQEASLMLGGMPESLLNLKGSWIAHQSSNISRRCLEFSAQCRVSQSLHDTTFFQVPPL